MAFTGWDYSGTINGVHVGILNNSVYVKPPDWARLIGALASGKDDHPEYVREFDEALGYANKAGSANAVPDVNLAYVLPRPVIDFLASRMKGAAA